MAYSLRTISEFHNFLFIQFLGRIDIMTLRNDSRLIAFPMLLIFAVLFAAPVAQSGEEVDTDDDKVSIIVELNESAENPAEMAEKFASEYNGEVIHTFENVLKGFSLKVSDSSLSVVMKDKRVGSASLNRRVKKLGFVDEEDEDKGNVNPNEQTVTLGVKRIGADEVTVDTEPNVNVAVIDTGIDKDHPDLKENVKGGASFVNDDKSNWNDGNGHGSHVAGTIGAVDNNIGILGINPDVNLYASQVLDEFGRGSFSGVIAGIDWVASEDSPDIDVANMSLGASAPDGEDKIHKAVKSAVEQGVTFAVAAGNSSKNADDYIPARYDEVTTVSAIDSRDDSYASFSNFGAKVDVAAPGVREKSSYKDGEYRRLSGTSMASPHTAGVIALALGIDSSLTPDEVNELLIKTGETIDFGDYPGDNQPEPLIDASALAETLSEQKDESSNSIN